MNNNNEDQGQRNAATLTRILEARRQARIPKLVRQAQRQDVAAAVGADELIERAAWVTEEA